MDIANFAPNVVLALRTAAKRLNSILVDKFGLPVATESSPDALVACLPISLISPDSMKQISVEFPGSRIDNYSVYSETRIGVFRFFVAQEVGLRAEQ